MSEIKYEHMLGRPFDWGKKDCLSLFRDLYAENFGIHIRNYARPTNWSSDTVDLMRLCYEREGFDLITDWKIKDLRPGDVLCMAIGEATPNHFAIFVGDDTIVHHLYGRMSTADPFKGFWRNRICYILRHPAVPDLRPVYPDVQLSDLIHARNAIAA